MTGPIKDVHDGKISEGLFFPFDEFIRNPALDLFDKVFVDKLQELNDKEEGKVYDVVEDEAGILRRKFRSQGPRRLKDALHGMF